MTSKEMEERSGIPRANLRYYEAEGLLTPAREKNGYRVYCDGDLAVLEKIQLLRRLGVSVEQLKALQADQLQLPDVLSARLKDLQAERETRDRVEQVCGELQAENVSFAGLDAPRYLRALEESSTPPALPAADAIPMAANPLRRFLARGFDWYLYLSLLFALLMLTGNNPALVSSTVLGIGAALLMAFLEPLTLHFTGTTPGKALLGLRLENADGARLSYAEGLSRVGMLAWYGVGLGIPVWSLIRLWRSLQRGLNEEPQPWDAGVAYTVKGSPYRRGLPFLLALAVLLGISEAVNCVSQLPPHRGELSVAEFAENFNRQADFLGMESGGELDAAGQWQKRQSTNAFYLDLSGWGDNEPVFTYTVADGELTAVTISGAMEHAELPVYVPTEKMLTAVAAFVWAQEDAPFWMGPRKDLMAEVEKQGNYTLHQGGVEITCQTEQEGFIDMQDGGYFPQEGTENFLHFTFSLTKERP